MKEYIDGDLVRYTSLYKEPIAEICEVRETSYLIRFMNGNFAKVTSKEIKPIPLTTDILEKNGWKTQNGSYYYLNVAKGFISLACFDKGLGNKFLCQKCKNIALKDLGDKNIYLH